MAGAADLSQTIEFGRFTVIRHRRELLADARSIELRARAFDTLMVLIDARGTVLGKDELIRRVLHDRVVEEDNLARPRKSGMPAGVVRVVMAADHANPLVEQGHCLRRPRNFFFEGESRGKERPSEGLSGSRWNSCMRVGEERAMSRLRWWVLALGSAMAIAGCASVPTTETDAAASAIADPSPSPTSEVVDSSETAEETVTDDYDPWEAFNTAMFS